MGSSRGPQCGNLCILPAHVPVLPIFTARQVIRLGMVSAGVAAAQWLALRLQIIAAVVVFSVALLAVLDTENMLPSTSSSRFVNVGAHPLPAIPLKEMITGADTITVRPWGFNAV